tara:strand:- start:2 stop:811 length:810 start_codon:yes stop_codon:yes gene_type:complete
VSTFEYKSYKKFVVDWVESQPRRGYGQYSKIAEAISSTSVIVSQIFKGSRHLTLEQSLKLAPLLSLNPLETEYFLALVQWERAGSFDLKRFFEHQIAELRSKGLMIRNRIEHHQLTNEDKMIFYSSWKYLAVWLCAALDNGRSAPQISNELDINEKQTLEILNFLLEKGLLVRKNGKFQLGQKVIHLSHDSPYILQHHLNWRFKALQAMENLENDSLHYSAPMSLSVELSDELKSELVEFIQKMTERVKDSKSQTLRCLNIDWFTVGSP